MLALERRTSAELKLTVTSLASAARRSRRGKRDALRANQAQQKLDAKPPRSPRRRNRRRSTRTRSTCKSVRSPADRGAKQVRDSSRSMAAQLAQNNQDLTAARDRSKELEAKCPPPRNAPRCAADATTRVASAETSVGNLSAQIDNLKEELARIATALDASEAKNKDQQVQLADLGRRLNQALASKVEELARYRSEFFGRLREVLGDRPDIRVVGDRFVFQSEVLFAPGSAALEPDALSSASQPVAGAIKEIAPKIPHRPSVGAGGRRPYRQSPDQHAAVPFELGAIDGAGAVGGALSCRAGHPARPPCRPRASANTSRSIPATTPDAYRSNRRIELKLTEP